MEGRFRNLQRHPQKRAPSRCPHGSLLNDRTDNCNKCKSYDGGAFTTKEILQKWSQALGLPIQNPATTKSGKNKDKTIEELCGQIGDYVADNGGELHDLLADVGFGSITTKKTIENKEREREKKALVQEAKVAASTLDEDKLLEIAQKMAAIKMAEKAEASSTTTARAPAVPSAPSEIPMATGFSWFEEEGAAQRSKRRAEEKLVTSTITSRLALKISSDAKQVMFNERVVATYPNSVKHIEIPQAGFLLFLRDGSYVYVGKVENDKGVLGVATYTFQSRDEDPSPIDMKKVNDKIALSLQTAYAPTFGRFMSISQYNTFNEKAAKETTLRERTLLFGSLSMQNPNISAYKFLGPL